jgi:hypothetical protein
MPKLLYPRLSGQVSQCPPQDDTRLVTEQQILDLKSLARLEQIGDQDHNGVHERKYRSADSALSCESDRMEFP